MSKTPLEAMEPLVQRIKKRCKVSTVIAEEAVLEVLEYRMELFTPLNNNTWQPGDWIMCGECPLDFSGFPVFHNKIAHIKQEV